MTDDQIAALSKLREPFPDHHISKLPKETRAQIDARKADKNLMVWKCDICGGAHHKNATHLDYVGHAALTDRLLSIDLGWFWEPVAFGPNGLPSLDSNGGLWIRLTVAGMSRLGYGDADGKTGGNAIKEAVGDSLRNAAMRFGAALDLWHKGDLHLDEGEDRVPDIAVDHSRYLSGQSESAATETLEPKEGWGDWTRALIDKVTAAATDKELDTIKSHEKRRINAVKKHDGAMHAEIEKAFVSARKAIADVPF